MRILAALGLALCAANAVAGDPAGTVRGVYYEAARGVMVDARLSRRPGAVRWLDVELADGRRVLAQLPQQLEAKAGDEVTVHLGEPKTTRIANVLPYDRVMAVGGREPESAGVGR